MKHIFYTPTQCSKKWSLGNPRFETSNTKLQILNPFLFTWLIITKMLWFCQTLPRIWHFYPTSTVTSQSATVSGVLTWVAWVRDNDFFIYSSKSRQTTSMCTSSLNPGSPSPGHQVSLLYLVICFSERKPELREFKSHMTGDVHAFPLPQRETLFLSCWKKIKINNLPSSVE